MLRPHLRVAFWAIAPLALAPVSARADFRAINLVSDGSVPAQTVDPSLVNPWGISYAPTGPFWVSDNGKGLSTLYDGQGVKQGLVVTVPPPLGSPAGTTSTPTGQAFNPGAASGAFGGNVFLFATEDGTVAGWKPPGAQGTILADNSAAVYGPNSVGAVYKGMDIGPDGHLYAANFREGKIDVFSSTVGGNGMLGSLGTIGDPNAPAGYAPFNVRDLNGVLYVTYAKQDAAGHDDASGAGRGFVDSYNPATGAWTRFASGSDVAAGGISSLNSPWGLAIAPTSFGPAFGGSLLVGNFGSGQIDAFDIATHAFLGQLTGPGGTPLTIDGLWDLTIGNDHKAGSSQTIYFTAGGSDEQHGVLGAINAVPEPGTFVLMGLGGLILMTGGRLLRSR